MKPGYILRSFSGLLHCELREDMMLCSGGLVGAFVLVSLSLAFCFASGGHILAVGCVTASMRVDERHRIPRREIQANVWSRASNTGGIKIADIIG